MTDESADTPADTSTIRIEITGAAAAALAGVPSAWLALEQARVDQERAEGETQASMLQTLVPLFTSYLETVLAPKKKAQCGVGPEWQVDPLGDLPSSAMYPLPPRPYPNKSWLTPGSEAYNALCRLFGFLIPVSAPELLSHMDQAAEAGLFDPSKEADLRLVWQECQKNGVHPDELCIGEFIQIPLHIRAGLTAAMSCLFGEEREAASAFLYVLASLVPEDQNPGDGRFWGCLAKSDPTTLYGRPQIRLMGHMLDRLHLTDVGELLSLSAFPHSLSPLVDRAIQVLNAALALSRKKSDGPLPEEAN